MAYLWQSPTTHSHGALRGSGVAPAVGWHSHEQQPWEGPRHWPGTQPDCNGRTVLPEIPPPALLELSSSLGQSRLAQIETIVTGLEHKLAHASYSRSKMTSFEDVQGDLTDLYSQLAYFMETHSAAEASRQKHLLDLQKAAEASRQKHLLDLQKAAEASRQRHLRSLHSAAEASRRPRPGAVQAPASTSQVKAAALTSSPSAGMLPTPVHNWTSSSVHPHTPASVLPPPPVVVDNGNGVSVAFSTTAAYRNGTPLQPSQDQEASLTSTYHALQNRMGTMERSRSDMQDSSDRLALETRRFSEQRMLLVREEAEQAEEAQELAREMAVLRESEEALGHDLAKARQAKEAQKLAQEMAALRESEEALAQRLAQEMATLRESEETLRQDLAKARAQRLQQQAAAAEEQQRLLAEQQERERRELAVQQTADQQALRKGASEASHAASAPVLREGEGRLAQLHVPAEQAEQVEQAQELAREVAALRESEETLRRELAKAQSVAAIADAQRCVAEEVREQQCMANEERMDCLQQHVNRSRAELIEARNEVMEQEQGAQDMILEMEEHLSTLLNTSASSSLLEFEDNLMEIRGAQADRCARVHEMERQMAVARASAASFSFRQGMLSAQGGEFQRPRWALPQPPLLPQQPSPLGRHHPRHARSPSSSSTLRDFPGFSLASSSSTPSLTPRRFPRSLASSVDAPAKSASVLPEPPWSARRLPVAPSRSLSSPATSRILPQPPGRQDAAAVPDGSFFVDFAERVRELSTDIAEAHDQSRSYLQEGTAQHQRIQELEKELWFIRAQNAGQLSSSSGFVGAERRPGMSQAAARERVREIAQRVGSGPRAPTQVVEKTLPAVLPLHCLSLQEALKEEEEEEESDEEAEAETEAEGVSFRGNAAVTNQELALVTIAGVSAGSAGLKAAAAAVEEEDTDADA